MDAAHAATQQLCSELTERDDTFATVFESWDPFRASRATWFGVAEAAMLNFAARA